MCKEILEREELTDFEKYTAVFHQAEHQRVLKHRQAYLESIRKEVKYELPSQREYLSYVAKKALKIDGFETTVAWESIFLLLLKYFTSDPAFESGGMSLRKGLAVIGGLGVGKTELVKLFAVNPKCSYIVKSVRDVAGEYSSSKAGHEVIEKYSGPIDCMFPEQYFGQKSLGICFDDIGTEQSRKNYGNETNVFEELIQNRYDLKDHSLTHCTHNLTDQQIVDFYGPRAYDRYREMFNVIRFPASEKSRRK